MNYEHKQDVVAAGNDFPAWLDEQSAEGWELLTMHQIGILPHNPKLLVAQPPQAQAGWLCVFRRKKIGPPKTIGPDGRAMDHLIVKG